MLLLHFILEMRWTVFSGKGVQLKSWHFQQFRAGSAPGGSVKIPTGFNVSVQGINTNVEDNGGGFRFQLGTHTRSQQQVKSRIAWKICWFLRGEDTGHTAAPRLEMQTGGLQEGPLRSGNSWAPGARVESGSVMGELL